MRVVSQVLIVPVVLSGLLIAAIEPCAVEGQSTIEGRSSLRTTVDARLSELDAPGLADRTRAERQLLDLGPDVLPLLPAPDLVRSHAVREAVKRVRVQLERRAARESALSSRVTLRGEQTLDSLLHEFFQQTRNRVELSSAAIALLKLETPLQSMTVEFDNRPFWDCLDEVCQRWSLRAEFDVQRAALMLAPRQSSDLVELTVQRSGPFRLAIHSVEVRSVVGSAGRRLLRVAGRIAVEPRVRPLFLHFAAGDVTAVAATKESITPWNPAAKYEHPVSDAGRVVPVQFDYVLPTEAATTPRENTLEAQGRTIGKFDLTGRVVLQVAAGTERIEFDKTSQTSGAARRRGGVTVRLRDVKFEPIAAAPLNGPLRGEIGVAVSYDVGGPAFESHRTWMFHNAVYLETETGQRIDFTEYDTAQQGNGGVAVSYRWENLVAPATRYKFVYEAPTLILDVPLDVKLNGLEANSK